MPRIPRIKVCNGTYHVIMRSPNEINLFKSTCDKDKFLSILKKYKEIYVFEVFSYCLMDTHIHLLIHTKKADISKIMKSINQSYAQYYNWKYQRRGHVFADRFKSIIAPKEENIISMSSYIHNNPKDIPGYSKNVENYPYSSFSIYIGKSKDKHKIINPHFILNYYSKDPIKAMEEYYIYVKKKLLASHQLENYKLFTSESKDIIKHNLDNHSYYYVSEFKPMVKSIQPEEVINFIFNNCKLNKEQFFTKYNHSMSNYRAIAILIMRAFCNYTIEQISTVINNFTQSSLSSLSSKGYLLISSDEYYRNIVKSFLEEYSA